MLIEAALNGVRSRTEHAEVPQTAAECAAAAKAAVAAGGGAVRFYVCASGRESLDAADVAQAVAAVREAVGKTPFGISTGDWIVRNTALRLEKVMAWTVLPPFVSINFNEEGAGGLARWGGS